MVTKKGCAFPRLVYPNSAPNQQPAATAPASAAIRSREQRRLSGFSKLQRNQGKLKIFPKSAAVCIARLTQRNQDSNLGKK